MFTRHIQTSIYIDASSAEIWDVLVDLESYVDWNPMLGNVQTGLSKGDTVRFDVLSEKGKPLKLKAKITDNQKERELAWRGGAAAILSGHHYFRVEALTDGRCRFHHGEHFSGLLLPLISFFLKDAPDLYRSMNEALKRRVEDQANCSKIPESE
jgi:hypothetical protein